MVWADTLSMLIANIGLRVVISRSADYLHFRNTKLTLAVNTKVQISTQSMQKMLMFMILINHVIDNRLLRPAHNIVILPALR
jgi:hypothetical protein